MKYLFIVLFFLSVNNAIQSQNLNFDKVSKAELEQKYHPKDSTAAAAILYNGAKTYFKYSNKVGFYPITDYFIRIKIYKKEGLEWGNFVVPYYVGWDNLNADSVEFKDCYTYNLENNKIEKNKLENEGLIKETINKYWKKKSIVMPNVKEGSIIEIKYTVTSESVSKLRDFYFQYDIPVNYATYISEIPEMILYQSIIRGYTKITPTQKKVSKSENVESRENNMSNYAIINYKSNLSIFELYDVPAQQADNFVDNPDNYRITLSQELQALRFPDREPKDYSTTWDDVAKSIYQNETFKKEINTRGYFESSLKNSIHDSVSRLNKLGIVFNHIKNTIKWDGTYGYFPNYGVKEAYQNRIGNVADINLNLVIFLRYLGFDASPVLISTRENGTTVFPSLDGFNYLIASVRVNEKNILLDATDANSYYNILPIRCLNGSGRILNRLEQSEEVAVNPTNLSKSITFIQADILPNGSMSGKVRTSKSDYLAYLFRNNFSGLNQEMYLEKLEQKYSGILISDYIVENSTKYDQNIMEMYSFSNENDESRTSDFISFNPFLFLTDKINPFKQEKRTMPIDFKFPTQEKYMITINIPEGYKVESIPKPATVALHENAISLSFKITVDQNKINIASVFDINKSFFDPSYYEDVKNLFKIYIEKQTESIILKKI
jgi:hypothetical protein